MQDQVGQSEIIPPANCSIIPMPKLFPHYNVREYENGCIMLESRELATPETISERTLEDMDQAIRNFKKIGRAQEQLKVGE